MVLRLTALTLLALAVATASAQPPDTEKRGTGRVLRGQVFHQPQSKVTVKFDNRNGPHATLIFDKVRLFCDDGSRDLAYLPDARTRINRRGSFDWDRYDAQGGIGFTATSFIWIKGRVSRGGSSASGTVLFYLNPTGQYEGAECESAGKRTWTAE
jgi:hypothetical protein